MLKNVKKRRGTALVEFVMLVPLIALIIGLTFFFGRSLNNKQRLKMADRYAAWRKVYGGGGSAPENLNEKFFERKATGVDVQTGGGPGETLEELVTFAGDYGGDAVSNFAGDLVLDDFPRGKLAETAAEWPASIGLWRDLGLTGALRSLHAREGVEWARGQAQNESAVRDHFLAEWDGAVRAMPPAGQTVSYVMGVLYQYRW